MDLYTSLLGFVGELPAKLRETNVCNGAGQLAVFEQLIPTENEKRAWGKRTQGQDMCLAEIGAGEVYQD